MNTRASTTHSRYQRRSQSNDSIDNTRIKKSGYSSMNQDHKYKQMNNNNNGRSFNSSSSFSHEEEDNSYSAGDQ